MYKSKVDPGTLAQNPGTLAQNPPIWFPVYHFLYLHYTTLKCDFRLPGVISQVYHFHIALIDKIRINLRFIHKSRLILEFYLTTQWFGNSSLEIWTYLQNATRILLWLCWYDNHYVCYVLLKIIRIGHTSPSFKTVDFAQRSRIIHSI